MLPLYLNNKENSFIKEVYNETASLKKQLVEVNWSDIKREIKKADPKKVVVTDATTNVIIPSTIIYKGKTPQFLQYTVDFSAGTNRYFEINTK